MKSFTRLAPLLLQGRAVLLQAAAVSYATAACDMRMHGVSHQREIDVLSGLDAAWREKQKQRYASGGNSSHDLH